MPFDNLPELDEIDLMLRRAREVVADGWCQGESYNYDYTRHCVIGAIREANAGNITPNYYKAVRRFAASLPAMYPDRLDRHGCAKAVTDWNDRVSRTRAQVLRQFDRVIQPIGANIG